MTVSKKDDFYGSVNDEWIEQAVIRDDSPRAGGFTDLSFDIEEELLSDTKDFANGTKPTPTYLQNFVDLFKQSMDEEARSKSLKDIQAGLDSINELKDWQDFENFATHLFYSNFASGLPFSISEDWLDTSKWMFTFDGLSLILPDKTYYDDPSSQQLLDIWKDQTVKLLSQLSYSEQEVQTIVDDALTFDKNLSQYVLSSEEMAEYFKLYHPVAFDEFAADFKTFDLKKIAVQVLDGTTPDKVVYFDNRFYENLNNVYQADNFVQYKNWLIAQSASLIGLTSEENREIAGTFGRTLSGQPSSANQDLWAFREADNKFGFLIGEYYRLQHFSPEAKANVEQMIQKMIAVFRERLEKNDWLSEATITEAIKKLDAIVYKIGYPDQIPARYLSYKVDLNESLFENLSAIDTAEKRFYFGRYLKPTDRSEWSMSADTVNAYYNPSS
ncbi:MAG: M13 family metallopeptidase, partial [Lactobacillaceae bacterium]|nr:M13 family metallopeptidase [Lactobacillaceae bacterium]